MFIQECFSGGAVNSNYCIEVKPRLKFIPTSQLDMAGSHYVMGAVKFPMETERVEKNELVPSLRGLKTEGTSVKGVKVHGQSMMACTPHCFPSVLFFLTSAAPPPTALLLSPYESSNITVDITVRQKSPH